MKTILYRRTALAILSLTILFILAIPAYADTAVLKRGDRTPEVKEAQAVLKELGFFDEDCTGYFGKVTEAAVKEFQKKYDLGSDGILGPTTISWLNKLSGEKIKLPSRNAASRKDTTKINVRYKIRKGDTIWDIAADYNVSVDSVLEYNGLSEDSILDIGKEIIIPNVVKVVKPAPAPAEAKPKEDTTAEGNNTGAEAKTVIPVQDSSELGNIYEYNKNIYVVKDGDTFESIAEDFGVTAEAILGENSFSSDTVLQIGQEVKIPEGVDVVIEEDTGTSSDKNGEYLDWFKEVQHIYEKGAIATVTDVETGKSFKVKRLYGRNHADSEPLTAEDTQIMKSLYGSWSWNRRAIIVTIKDKKGVERRIAASMNGMPHGGESIGSANKFKGHFCIHFKNSRTHSGSRLDASHQKAVKVAAGL
ncbi:MAG TPA: LysM peptidoglycan-binding domain-containing protein [Clostridia bacterium]|nr:LysM peptidoglycan-binding domain-containing protein [Clostridia bacterium]